MSTLETAQPVDISHLTGVTYSAVQTMVHRGLHGDLIGLAMDGNGRSTTVTGIDPMLGQLAQHAQVLQAHFAQGTYGIRDFLPGYLEPGRLDDPKRSSTLVWVLS